MNNQILVLQFRSDKSLYHEREQIIKRGKFKKDELKFVNVMDLRQKVPKPTELANYKAAIIAGSGQYNLTKLAPQDRIKIKRIIPLIKDIIKRDFPTLGICFGHQLIAYLYGGRVESDEDQSENGTYELTLNAGGLASPVFKNIPKSFYAVLGHKDSVTKLPKGANHLASSVRCKYQAYRLKKNIYCVQSHPELDKEGLLFRLRMYPEYLKHKSFSEVKKQFMPVKYAANIILNFKGVVEETEF
jgi:GMP synthase (glutamine-hydrolysing)